MHMKREWKGSTYYVNNCIVGHVTVLLNSPFAGVLAEYGPKIQKKFHTVDFAKMWIEGMADGNPIAIGQYKDGVAQIEEPPI